MWDSINRMCLYNAWANQLFFDSYRSNSNKIPGSAISLMSHILNAQMIWLGRISGETINLKVWDNHSFEECEAYHLLSSSDLLAVVTVATVDGDRNIAYTTSLNAPFNDSLHNILLHIFNHGTYHRAQIAKDMKINGLEPLNTDYIRFVRSGSLN